MKVALSTAITSATGVFSEILSLGLEIENLTTPAKAIIHAFTQSFEVSNWALIASISEHIDVIYGKSSSEASKNNSNKN